MTLKFHEDSDIYCLACRIEFFIPILRTSCCVPIRNSDFSGRNVGRSALRMAAFTEDHRHRDKLTVIFSHYTTADYIYRRATLLWPN